MKQLTGLFAVLALAPALCAQDMPLSQILIPGEGWRKVEGTFKPIKNLFSGDSGNVTVWDESNVLQAQISGKDQRVSTNVENAVLHPQFRQLATGNDKEIQAWYDPERQSIYVDDADKKKGAVKGFKLPQQEPSAVCQSNDLRTLFVGDKASRYVWAYRLGNDGLSAGEKYITLRLRRGETRSETAAIDVDASNRIYVAMKDGVQVFDPTGRLCGLLLNPTKEKLTGMCFGGEKADHLFIACGKDIYRRRLDTTRAFPKPAEKK